MSDLLFRHSLVLNSTKKIGFFSRAVLLLVTHLLLILAAAYQTTKGVIKTLATFQ